jgi:hypothetical protein
MGNNFAAELTGFLLLLLPMLGCWWWFRTPKIVFAAPQDRGEQEFLTWWHVPLEIKPGFFQQKSISGCSISVYIHASGVGTIRSEIQLCWRTSNGPQRTATLRKGEKYLVPVALRSTHWKACAVKQDGDSSPRLIVPPRMALLSDATMMLEGRIPQEGLANEYYFSFRVRSSGKNVVRSGLYELLVPAPIAENSKFRFARQGWEPESIQT